MVGRRPDLIAARLEQTVGDGGRVLLREHVDDTAFAVVVLEDPVGHALERLFRHRRLGQDAIYAGQYRPVGRGAQCRFGR